MFASALVASFFAAASFATPIVKNLDVLQYALTLEHLENAFYTEGLYKYDAKAFEDAGFPPIVRERFEQIAKHEKTHVDFLTSVIGAGATKACTYEFPYTDLKSYLTLSQLLEGVGVSAYTGAAQFLTVPEHVTAAASILSTEARHASWVAAAVNKDTPWSGPFDIPLNLNQVFSLAAPLIKECPSDNPTLPVKAFPTLTASSTTPAVGSELTLTFDAGHWTELWAAIFTGLDVTFVPLHDGKFIIPEIVSGTVYVVVTSDGTKVNDETTVAGPVTLFFPSNE